MTNVSGYDQTRIEALPVIIVGIQIVEQVIRRPSIITSLMSDLRISPLPRWTTVAISCPLLTANARAVAKRK